MGLFSFLGTAGAKIFGGGAIDENKVREHVLAQGLQLDPFTVVAHPDEKMVSLIGFAKTMEDKEKAIVAAGNVTGVEKVDDRLKVGVAPAAPVLTTDAPEGDAPSAKFVTVVAGDTLSKIAKAQYGDANKYNLIFEANKPMLTHPDKIYPGQVLRIPPAA